MYKKKIEIKLKDVKWRKKSSFDYVVMSSVKI